MGNPGSLPDPGLYVGGSIRILGNNGGNLYLSSGKTVTLGTGVYVGGNGVAAPEEDMDLIDYLNEKNILMHLDNDYMFFL